MNRKPFANYIIRSTVSVTLIYILFRRIDLNELKLVVLSSDWILLAFSTGLILARQVIAATRWRIILSVYRVRISILKLSYWYMVAAFLNMFLPTVMGGDAARIYALSKNIDDMPSSTASVIMERLLGFLAMLTIAMTASIANPHFLENKRVLFSLCAVASAFILSLLFLFNNRILQWGLGFIAGHRLDRFGKGLERFSQALRVLVYHRKILTLTFMASLLFQLVGILAVNLIGRSLGLEISSWYYLIVVPVIWLITMIPLSINGMGVREGAFVLMFGVVGISSAEALIMSLLTFAQLILIGLAGGVLYLVSPLRNMIKISKLRS